MRSNIIDDLDADKIIDKVGASVPTPRTTRTARPAVSRTVLRDQIKDVLMQRILDGDYGPGERIVEIRVAEEFGVSQAPVREALRELEILRLVVSEPFRGARVREVSSADLLESYPVRAALEEVAARQAAPRLGGQLDAMRAEIDAMRSAAAAQDLPAFVRADVGFHRLFVVASGNRTLLELWESLHVDLRTRFTLIQRLRDLPDVAESHEPILAALASGDGERAGRLVREHIEGFGRWVAEHPPGALEPDAP
jgi:DNA-binding GntR family transcriptional regulator